MFNTKKTYDIFKKGSLEASFKIETIFKDDETQIHLLNSNKTIFSESELADMIYLLKINKTDDEK